MPKNSTHCCQYLPCMSRRDFLATSSLGFGALAAADLLAGERAGDPPAPRPAHTAGKAKSVILLFMTGGPSHVDTFDPKPELSRFDGQKLPESFDSENLDLQFMRASDGTLMASPFAFVPHGDSGLEISELFPHLAQHADRLAVVRSCFHESFIHGPAITYMCTGSLLLGHPSIGAWVTYGLGSESDSLPAYIVMSDGGFRGGAAMYQSGFLPAVYQGTVMRNEGTPFQNLSSSEGVTPEQQSILLEQLQVWNSRHRDARLGDSRLDARLANYELAYRMQMAAPELIDLSPETEETLALYGIDEEPGNRFRKMCLFGRRMVERGVRFVQLINNDWDGHGQCAENHRQNARRIDKPIAGLLTDLARRGLLDETLVVWCGEFGRTPVMQGDKGRDHNPHGFSIWMAGGGIRGGKAIGATDDFGFRAVDDRVHVHDIHATMLSLLGIDHARLTYLFEGRERRLTDVGGQNDLSQRLLS